jgi:1-acyl-sn-glycerol-3-phosphate acyltransferase
MISPRAATELFAALMLAALVLGLVGYLLALRQRLPLTFAQSVCYGLNVLVARVLWGARGDRSLPAPPGRGAVIVCNHRSPADPSFIQIATYRPVRWMVAREFCRAPAYGWLLRLANVIPTGRGGIDTAAIREAIRHAHDGGLLGVFPEGRINPGETLLLPGRPGAALIALKARVPVIPCYLEGAPYAGTIVRSLLRSDKVTVRFGQPMDLSPYYGREREREVLEELTRRFLREIARLAGHPDYEPQLAGRFYKPGPAPPAQAGRGHGTRPLRPRRAARTARQPALGGVVEDHTG